MCRRLYYYRSAARRRLATCAAPRSRWPYERRWLGRKKTESFKRETSEADVYFIAMMTATALDAFTPADMLLGIKQLPIPERLASKFIEERIDRCAHARGLVAHRWVQRMHRDRRSNVLCKHDHKRAAPDRVVKNEGRKHRHAESGDGRLLDGIAVREVEQADH